MAEGTGSKLVVTTGANSGIGLATVLEVARRGFESVGTVRSKEKGRSVEAAAAEAGVEVRTEILDVTDASACEALVERLRPYALVNNAGFSVTGAVEDVGDDEVRLALETMLVAPMRLARAAISHMREGGGGRIVNISSIYGITTTPLTGWYQAAKHGLEAVSDALRMEVAGAGIKVVLVEPGGFRTGIWQEMSGELSGRSGSRYAGSYDRLLTGTRLAQPVMGEPDRVARVVAGAIASRAPRARYLVGYDAQAAALLDRLSPTSVKDRLTRIVLGL